MPTPARQLDAEIASSLAGKSAATSPVKGPISEATRKKARAAVRKAVRIHGARHLTPKNAQELVDHVLRDFPGLAAQGGDESIEVWDTNGHYSGPEFALRIEDEYDYLGRRQAKRGEVR